MMSDRRVLAGWFSADLVRHGDGMVRLLASVGIDGRAMTAVQRAKAYQEWAMNEEAKKAAADIAERFGETGKRPRAQLRRMAVLMGAEWMREVLGSPELTMSHIATKNGKPRTAGGAFFVLARSMAKSALNLGLITKRDFFRCFYDRPKRVKVKPAPKPKRPPPKQKPAPRKPVVAEVYHVRTTRRAS